MIIDKKNFITLEESKDKLIGKVGTPDRDAYEEEIRLFSIGAAISVNLDIDKLGRVALC